jgi:tetratricopeptide (TPR) repeat protein
MPKSFMDWVVLASAAATVLGFGVAVFFTTTDDHNTIRDAQDVVQISENSGEITIGLSQEDFLATLTRREGELRADLERAHGAEQALLQAQLDVVLTEKADVETAYRQTLEELGRLQETLRGFEGKVPAAQLQAAENALNRGERQLADEIFAQVERNSEQAVADAARAAFGRGEIAEAEVRWHDAATHYTRAASLDPTPQTLHKATHFAQLAGDYARAERLAADYLALARAGDDTESLSQALDLYAIVARRMGRHAEAEVLFREALGVIRATKGPENSAYGNGLNNLAGVVQAQGRHAEAEALYRQAMEIDRATIGELHPDYATRLNNLGSVVQAQGRHAEAEALYRQAMEIDRATIGELHPDYGKRSQDLTVSLA